MSHIHIIYPVTHTYRLYLVDSVLFLYHSIVHSLICFTCLMQYASARYLQDWFISLFYTTHRVAGTQVQLLQMGQVQLTYISGTLVTDIIGFYLTYIHISTQIQYPQPIQLTIPHLCYALLANIILNYIHTPIYPVLVLIDYSNYISLGISCWCHRCCWILCKQLGHQNTEQQLLCCRCEGQSVQHGDMLWGQLEVVYGDMREMMVHRHSLCYYLLQRVHSFWDTQVYQLEGILLFIQLYIYNVNIIKIQNINRQERLNKYSTNLNNQLKHHFKR